MRSNGRAFKSREVAASEMGVERVKSRPAFVESRPEVDKSKPAIGLCIPEVENSRPAFQFCRPEVGLCRLLFVQSNPLFIEKRGLRARLRYACRSVGIYSAFCGGMRVPFLFLFLALTVAADAR